MGTYMNFVFPATLLVGTPFSNKGKGYFDKLAKYNGSEYECPLKLSPLSDLKWMHPP